MGTTDLIAGPFLTKLDPRGGVKGSRDPLGIQTIWIHAGRQVIGNLTNQTTSVRDFSVLLIGIWLIQQLREAGSSAPEAEVFLKWEQLAAYARAHPGGQGGFRGIDRVRATIDQGHRVPISAEGQCQILGNQRIYGVWGLYTQAARASGLLDTDPARLAPGARALVETQYVPALARAFGRGCSRLLGLLPQRLWRFDLDGPDARNIADVLGEALQPAEVAFFREALLFGGPDDRTGGLQRRMIDLLEPTLADAGFAFAPGVVRQFAREAARRWPDDSRLAVRLHKIATLESFLAPVSELFAFLLGWDGKPPGEAAAAVASSWGAGLDWLDLEAVAALRGDLEAACRNFDTAEHWLEVARLLKGGEYEPVVERLLAINHSVMAARSGAGPWIDVQAGKLRVRFVDERGALTERADLPKAWRFPYFLDALRDVARSLREAA
ncbi:MAG: hypothetical protein FJZ01_15895 [Candidatus Sericytochromatia bacterium]|nr:hypothetical protein [Candidatus Tanganyikabacteria bacterium]